MVLWPRFLVPPGPYRAPQAGPWGPGSTDRCCQRLSAMLPTEPALWLGLAWLGFGWLLLGFAFDFGLLSAGFGLISLGYSSNSSRSSLGSPRRS